MSDYKKLMGYGKKKKVVKKPTPSKPKVNEVLENIKEEFGLVKEVGASAEYKAITTEIEKTYVQYSKSIIKLRKILDKKGLKKESKLVYKQFAKGCLGFHSWLRGFVNKLL